MALSIRSRKVEALARMLADRTGLNMTDAIAEALQARLAGMGALPDQVLARLQSIAETCAAAPDLDTRPADEILGYNAEGLFGDGR
jgi:antitoxin VapB